jgi:branched-chain amino acid transport system ATP-binding protein
MGMAMQRTMVSGGVLTQPPPGADADASSDGMPLGNPANAVLSARGLVKRYGGLVVTSKVDLDVLPGEVHALVGPNGAGKTTLLGQLTGEIHSDEGRILFRGKDITRLPPHRRAQLGLARSFQITSVFHELSVLENAMFAVQAKEGHSFRFWKNALADEGLTGAAHALLERVGLAAEAGRPASDLSHGQHRQLEIAIALAGAPQVLLLDEPMAGMGIEDSAHLTRMLLSLKGSVPMLLVEHDMDAVFALADRITVLVYGERIVTGTPAEIRAHPEVRRAYLG